MHRRVVPPCAASEGYDENRVRRLLDVGRALTCELDEGVVLERVLETARQLTGARYAALGILNEQKTELARFLTLGVDDEAHAAIGDLPRGRGVLGALIDDPRPLRLSDVGSSPDSYGFPAGHPVMRSFLGVPVVVRGEVWGNLYLTEKEAGDFSEQDEATAVILADWAAVAIEPLPAGSEERLAGFTELLRAAIANVESRAGLARLVEEQAALRRVATLVARGAQQEELFAAVAREAGELLAVDFAAVGRYEPDGTVTGLATWSADGRLFPVLAEPQVLGGENVTTIVSQTGHPARIDSYVDPGRMACLRDDRGDVLSPKDLWLGQNGEQAAVRAPCGQPGNRAVGLIATHGGEIDGEQLTGLPGHRRKQLLLLRPARDERRDAPQCRLLLDEPRETGAALDVRDRRPKELREAGEALLAACRQRLDRDGRPVGEDHCCRLILLAEIARLLLGQIEVAPDLPSNHDGHAEEAAHHGVPRWKAIAVGAAADVTQAQGPWVVDQRSQHPTAARKVSDRRVGLIVDPQGQEARELGLLLVEDPERRVSGPGQLPRSLEHALQHNALVELARQRSAHIQQAANTVLIVSFAGGARRHNSAVHA